MRFFLKAVLFYVAAATPCRAFSVTPAAPPPLQNLPSVVATTPDLRSPVLSTHIPNTLRSSTNFLAAATLAPAAGVSTKQGGPPVFITDINYDGKVPTTEADEYVVLTNGRASPLDISGYYIYVATSGSQGSTFTFPKNSMLKPSASVRIYTNEIHMETGGYSFGSGRALWNNRGGLAVVKDNNGKKIGEFKYAAASKS